MTTRIQKLADIFATRMTEADLTDVFYCREDIEIQGQFHKDGGLEFKVSLGSEYGEGLTLELAFEQAARRASTRLAMARRERGETAVKF